MYRSLPFLSLFFLLPSLSLAQYQIIQSDEIEELDWGKDYILLYDHSGQTNAKILAFQLRNQIFPYVKVQNDPLTVASGVEKVVPFGETEEETIPSMHNPSNSISKRRLVAPRTGTYEFMANINYKHIPDHEDPEEFRYYCVVRKGPGSPELTDVAREERIDLARFHQFRIKGTVDLNADEYLEVYLWHDRGESLQLATSHFVMWRVH